MLGAMQISVFGIKTEKFEYKINNENLVDTKHDFTIEYQYEVRKSDVLMTIFVSYNFSSPNNHYSIVSKFKTGFQLITADAKFLQTPTNPNTLTLLCDLTQAAISHARADLIEATKEIEVRVMIPFFTTEQLKKTVLDNFKSLLN